MHIGGHLKAEILVECFGLIWQIWVKVFSNLMYGELLQVMFIERLVLTIGLFILKFSSFTSSIQWLLVYFFFTVASQTHSCMSSYVI